MAYLELKDLSKIYAGEGAVSVGIRKVSLAFEKGEFVAITGKSGAGKTTLLNVIGGLEPFEEGEMYINGQPTSPYTQQEWEEYQAANISCIFQNYNILESFTVLENVEFALTSISDLKERRERARKIIERVGLKDRAHIRGSKLSGGEKQRTVIARAIAKDSPIILADEPTGNLDSKTAKDVLKLLREVSDGKLVIVVTHNFEDVKEYATRHIRIFDGEIESDDCLVGEKPTAAQTEGNEDFSAAREFVFRKRRKKASEKGKRSVALRDCALLGIKRFFSRPKQGILMSAVLTIALICMLCAVSFMSSQNTYSYGVNVNPIEGRVLVADQDGTGYTQAEAEALAARYNAESALRNDCFLEQGVYVNLTKSDSFLDAERAQIVFSDKKPQEGRLPQAAGDVTLYMPYTYRGEWKVGDTFVFGQTGYRSVNGVLCEVVGIGYFTDNRNSVRVCVTEETYALYANLSRYEISLAEKKQTESAGASEDVSDETEVADIAVGSGQSVSIVVDFSLNGKTAVLYCGKEDGLSGTPVILFSGEEKGLVISETKYGIPEEYAGGNIYVAEISADFVKEDLAWEASEQISLLYKTDKEARENAERLRADGYQVVLATEVRLRQEQVTFLEKFLQFLGTGMVTLLVGLAMMLILILTLHRLISATRGDVSIFRTMGIAEKTVKRATYIQLLCALVPACVLLCVFAAVVYFTSVGRGFTFVGIGGTIAIVLVVAVLVWLLGVSYNRILYKERVKKGLRRVNK